MNDKRFLLPISKPNPISWHLGAGIPFSITEVTQHAQFSCQPALLDAQHTDLTLEQRQSCFCVKAKLYLVFGIADLE